MIYDLIIENKVEKHLLTLDKSIVNRIIDAVDKLKTDPKPHNCIKLQVLDGYRIKVGKYRILYSINEPEKIITIYKVSKRDDAYK